MQAGALGTAEHVRTAELCVARLRPMTEDAVRRRRAEEGATGSPRRGILVAHGGLREVKARDVERDAVERSARRSIVLGVEGRAVTRERRADLALHRVEAHGSAERVSATEHVERGGRRAGRRGEPPVAREMDARTPRVLGCVVERTAT